ncbi:MAG: hypothetical protein ACRDSP_03810 [Pseudonocardiaceae bacterium]
MSGSWVGVVLLALAGFLLGGVVSAWRTSRPMVVILGVFAVLAAAGGVAWLL